VAVVSKPAELSKEGVDMHQHLGIY
jgi:hypothetical protein